MNEINEYQSFCYFFTEVKDEDPKIIICLAKHLNPSILDNVKIDPEVRVGEVKR